jgi:hypothetical protein
MQGRIEVRGSRFEEKGFGNQIAGIGKSEIR